MYTLYQTVLDTGDPDKIETNGPIKCTSNDAWLGHGFYFWDWFIDLAHHWGKTHCGGRYVICRAFCDFLRDEIYDLINNPEHIQEFHDVAEDLIETYKDKDKLITVPFIFEYLKSIDAFSYKAIRACGIGSFPNLSIRISFVPYHSAFIESLPAWQVCILNKASIKKDSYRIVYPDEYTQDYVV